MERMENGDKGKTTTGNFSSKVLIAKTCWFLPTIDIAEVEESSTHDHQDSSHCLIPPGVRLGLGRCQFVSATCRFSELQLSSSSSWAAAILSKGQHQTISAIVVQRP
jgi:hypothetical protein